MEREPKDITDVPGHDRATGIDDPVPDSEYGDQDRDPGENIDPAENDDYLMEDEYVVEPVPHASTDRAFYGTYLANDARDAAELAQVDYPKEDLSLVQVTHMASGNLEQIDLEPSGTDPDGTTDTGTLDYDVDEFLEQYTDYWSEVEVSDGDGFIYVHDLKNLAFETKTALAEHIHDNMFPKQRYATVNITGTIPYDVLEPGVDEEAAAERMVRDELEILGMIVKDVETVALSGNVPDDLDTESSPSVAPDDTPEHEVFD